ncbi:MAG: peptide/nickel transport system ATP-binding protein [Solirubrobacteraceae bacterium]|jgi:peptide/nickel transport system ATP-binding protein|nr:peptide/nickel transport system ATP-binding protein [Solirubrobacteraceae bacterium]
MAGEPLLRVEDLRVHFDTPDGVVRAVDGISYELERGRVLGIVGESGSGKTVSSLAIMGLLGAERAHVSGRVLLGGRDLLALGDEQMRAIRGNEIAMVFQDPLSALHPFHRVGAQVGEAIRAHRDVSRRQARARTVQLLETVGIPDAARRAGSYPHELSGGMRQRAMIAMALANEPALLVADEPTTALDVTVQAQILDLVARLKDELGMAVLIITHDLGIVAETADEVAVMYAGRIVERGPVERIFAAPEHPYTWGLLRSMPRLDTPRGEELVPIPGRPPSLAGLPDGCAFAPRCPYVRPRHREIEPALEPLPGTPGHAVACLLPAPERRRLWAALRSGRSPQQARAEVDGGGAQ